MTDAYPIATLAIGALLTFVTAALSGSAAASMGFPVPARAGRIGCIDALRGYLAISVLIHHFVIWLQVTKLDGRWASPTVYALNNCGAGAVALFFMATGLVFYPRILAGFAATSWLATFVKRAFRLLPLIVLSVVLVTTIIIARTGASFDRAYLEHAAEWVATWSQPDLLDYPESGRLDAYVLWSLWFEWVFTLTVLPVCALAMDLASRCRMHSAIVPAALFLVALGAREAHLWGRLPKYLPLFAIGMLAYEVQRAPAIRAILQSRTMAAIALTSLSFAAIFGESPYDLDVMAMYAVFFTSVACGNTLFGLLATRASSVLGEVSYGVYLLHGITLSLFFVDGPALARAATPDHLVVALPFIAIVTIAIATTVHILVEKPMIEVGRRISVPRRPLRHLATAMRLAELDQILEDQPAPNVAAPLHE